MNLTRLSSAELQTLYDSLHAETWPTGTFDGHVLGLSVWPIWRGKVFPPRKSLWARQIVRNLILGWECIQGDVALINSEVVIDYPQLGIRDTLKPVSSTLWLGQAHLWFGWRVWFVLESQTGRGEP